MNHPMPDDWTNYLYGELDPKIQAAYTSHLRACADCRGIVSSLRGAMYALDQWEMPEKSRSAGVAFRATKWGIAALLVLGVGFGFGRFTAPSAPDVSALRAELEASIRASLKTTIREEVRLALDARSRGTALTGLASLRNDLKDELKAYVDAQDKATRTAVLAASKAEATREIGKYAQTHQASQERDRQMLVAAMRELNLRRLADFNKLQSDLDTLVVLTDDELQRTRGEVGRWLTVAQPGRTNAPQSDATEERNQE